MISLGIETFLVKLKDPLGAGIDAKSAAFAQIFIKRNLSHIKPPICLNINKHYIRGDVD